MYEYTDQVIDYLLGYCFRRFARLKTAIRKGNRTAKLDEITALNAVNELYAEMELTTRKRLAKVAENAYRRYCDDDFPAEMWLSGFLDGYSFVTRYVFTKECERKKSRLYEALIASNGDVKEINKALRFWSKMMAEYAVEVTDAATLKPLRIAA